MTSDTQGRQNFYQSIPDFWPDLYEMEYALYDVATITATEVAHIRIASEKIWHIFTKTLTLLQLVPDATLLSLGFPKNSLPYLRLTTLPLASVIARLDLIPYHNSYKCIEINADTPTFIKELFTVNQKVCEHFNVNNPNKYEEARLFRAIRASVEKSAPKETAHIVFTAHSDDIEDALTVRYLQSAIPHAHFTPLHRLHIVRHEGLYDEVGRKIDVLYRQTFPLEQLLEDTNEQGDPIGEWLLELVQQRKLAIINPPSAFLLQNKAVQAVIWGLHDNNDPYFTPQDHCDIAHYFLPTYLENTPFITAKQAFVEKPIFGREGDTVRIFEGTNKLRYQEEARTYTTYPYVYQAYVKQPIQHFKTEQGMQQGSLLLGSFIVGNQASAIGYRVGATITNNLSYYLPLGML